MLASFDPSDSSTLPLFSTLQHESKIKNYKFESILVRRTNLDQAVHRAFIL